MKKLLTIITISALTVSTLVGCGKTNEKSDNTNEPTVVAEQPTETVEVTAEPTEKVELTETPDTKNNPDGSEENLESREVDLTGYLEDYPLTLGDQKVYVQLPEDYNFYADTAIYDSTYIEYLNDFNFLVCYKSIEDAQTIDFMPQIQFTIDSAADINWYKENAETGYSGSNTFEVNENKKYDNGITTYKIAIKYEGFEDTYVYIATYEIDDHTCQITMNNISEDEANTLFEFFGNLEYPVIVK